MRKILGYLFVFLAFLVCFNTKGYALEFEAGTYYFDNSKINYTDIKFATFDTINTSVTVYDVLPTGSNGWWKLIIEEPVSCDLYSFVESFAMAKSYNETVSQFLRWHTTRHTQLEMWFEMNPLMHPHNPGYVYCPIMNDEVSDGYWRPQESYNAMPSGTLPVIHISTQDSRPIISKDNYISATLWLDNCGIEEFQSIGSEEMPIDMLIKGRGNYTWRAFYKKPYKIKFDDKQSPLGLDNSRHFILMPHADDLSGYLRDETGFELSRRLGMKYTPTQKPVEVILNGEYIGLYFLCEKIRVEKGRVDIIEQQDNDTNPYNVSGGWLLELSGNGNVVHGQHENNDPSRMWYWFESHSPENVSQVQRDYISRFISQADSCIFVDDKNDRGWENYLDVFSLSRFYVINEVMSNIESFCRSMFVYKDWGEGEKLKFGPVWDFGNSFTYTGAIGYIDDYHTQFTFLWLKELLKFPGFRNTVLDVWKIFMEEDVLDKVFEHDLQMLATIETAKQFDKVRWPYYGDLWSGAAANYLDLISRKVAWLDEKWGVPVGDVNCDGVVTAADVTAIYDYLLNNDETHLSTSDVNGDGEITAADVTALYDILLEN